MQHLIVIMLILMALAGVGLAMGETDSEPPIHVRGSDCHGFCPDDW